MATTGYRTERVLTLPRELGDVNKDGVDTSQHVYFMHNRIALRLENIHGEAYVAALHQEAVDKLLSQLQKLRDV